MFAIFWFVFLVCGVAILFSFPAIVWLERRRRYSGERCVSCPEIARPVLVELESQIEAHELFGTPMVSISSCERWPGKAGCAQECLPEAIEHAPADAFLLNHLAIFVTALSSWAISGALRYSPLAREWFEPAGMASNTFWASIGHRWPVVLSFFGSIVVAYVFVWIMRHTQQSGVARALGAGALLWLLVLGVTLPETVFFVPLRVFAFDAMTMLIALFVQAVLIGILVLPATVERTWKRGQEGRRSAIA